MLTDGLTGPQPAHIIPLCLPFRVAAHVNPEGQRRVTAGILHTKQNVREESPGLAGRKTFKVICNNVLKGD